MSMNLREITDADLQSLSRQAEERALVGAVQIIGLAAPGKSEEIYHAWRDVLIDQRDKPNRAEAFGALAMLIADYLSAYGEERPHSRRVEAAQMIALAHCIIEGATSDNRAIN